MLSRITGSVIHDGVHTNNSHDLIYSYYFEIKFPGAEKPPGTDKLLAEKTFLRRSEDKHLHFPFSKLSHVLYRHWNAIKAHPTSIIQPSNQHQSTIQSASVNRVASYDWFKIVTTRQGVTSERAHRSLSSPVAIIGEWLWGPDRWWPSNRHPSPRSRQCQGQMRLRWRSCQQFVPSA